MQLEAKELLWYPYLGPEVIELLRGLEAGKLLQGLEAGKLLQGQLFDPEARVLLQD